MVDPGFSAWGLDRKARKYWGVIAMPSEPRIGESLGASRDLAASLGAWHATQFSSAKRISPVLLSAVCDAGGPSTGAESGAVAALAGD